MRRGHLLRALGAFMVFGTVEYAAWVAVLLWAYDRGGPAMAGMVGVVQLAPAAFLAPLLGHLGDRLPRRRALLYAYLAEALLLALLAGSLASNMSTLLTIVLAAAVTTSISVVRPVHYALLPELVTTPAALVSANSASGVGEAVGVFLGPVLAGVIATLQGPDAVVAACAVAMLAAALSTLSRRNPQPSAGESVDEETSFPLLLGLRTVAADRGVVLVMTLVGASFLVAGALEILGIAYATAVLDGSDATAGIVVGSVGVGALLGAAAASGLAFQRRLALPVAVAVAAAGAPLVAMPAVASLLPACLLLALAGGFQAVSIIASRTLLQRITDDTVLARVLAVHEGAGLLGMAAGAIVAPLTIAALGARLAYVPLGLGLLSLGAVSVPVLHRLDSRAVVRSDVLELLRHVGFVARMSPPAVNRMARHATWVQVRGGDTVIRQGDPGDAYYVVASGEMSVHVDAVERRHRVTAHDGFGEIALVRDVPRTATVRAVGDARLLRIDRADFLAAVTGGDAESDLEVVTARHLARDARHAAARVRASGSGPAADRAVTTAGGIPEQRSRPSRPGHAGRPGRVERR